MIPIPFTLKVGASKEDVSGNVTSLSVSEGLHEPFSIRVSLTWWKTKGEPQSFLDQFVELTLIDPDDSGSLGKLKGDRKKFFQLGSRKQFLMLGETEYLGRVTQEQAQYYYDHGMQKHQYLIQLVIESPFALLRHGSAFHIFYKKSIKAVFETVLKRHKTSFEGGGHKVSWDLSGVPEAKPEYLVQYKEDDLSFLMRLCEMYGIGFTQIGDTLKFIPGSELSSGSELSNMSYDSVSSWTRHRRNLSQKLVSRNLKDGAKLDKVSMSQEQVQAMNGARDFSHQIEQYFDEKDAADVFIKARGHHLTNQQEVLHLNSMRGMDEDEFAPLIGLRVGHVIPAPPVGGGGPILVEDVDWHYTGVPSEPHYDLDAILCSTKKPYAPPFAHPPPQVDGFLRARVIAPKSPSHVDSEEKLGRIRVLFLWDEKDDAFRSSRTCWVRLMMPYSGDKHGIFVMPEVDDEVIIGFEGGDINRPVALGSVPQKGSAFLSELTGEAAKQLETMAFNSRQGKLKMRAWEKEGQGAPKHKVTIELAEKINLTLTTESETDARLTSEGTAGIIAKKTITIQSEEKIELLCGKSKIVMDKDGNILIEGLELTVKGKNISTEMQQDAKTQAMNVKTTAQQGVETSAMQVKTSAQQAVETSGMQVKTQAQVKLEMSGTMVDVKGSAKTSVSGGLTEIKGGLVKIN